jgi:hypothetical protein
MADQVSAEQIFVNTALRSWDVWLGRATKLFYSLSEDELQTEIAPAKNRAVYVLGHLLAVNDAMIPALRLGEATLPGYWEPFVTKPDRAVEVLPPIAELRENWKSLTPKLAAHFQELTPAQWLEHHSTVSEEDFAKEPHRNRLAILLSRTGHLSYHVGQLLLMPRKPAA